MHRAIGGLALFGLMALCGRPDIADAAEIRVLCTRAIVTVLEKVGPEFERTTGHRLNVSMDVSARIVRRVQAGEPVDLVVGTPAQIDALTKEGRIVPDTRANLVRSGIGVEVRAGAPKPDIGSVEAFKRALLDAKSIGYLKEGASGVYLAGMLERIGIAAAIESKVIRPDTDIVSELVAQGRVELGMVVVTQILTTPGVELVGPLPSELQYYVTFTGGVSTSSSTPDATKELIKFLTGPVALPVIRAQGMEPGV